MMDQILCDWLIKRNTTFVLTLLLIMPFIKAQYAAVDRKKQNADTALCDPFSSSFWFFHFQDPSHVVFQNRKKKYTIHFWTQVDMMRALKECFIVLSSSFWHKLNFEQIWQPCLSSAMTFSQNLIELTWSICSHGWKGKGWCSRWWSENDCKGKC